MITNTGKQILAKYLMGTTPSYAAYIGIGCGVKPRPLTTTISGASSSSGIITVTSTDDVWVGAKVTKVSGTGALSTTADTLVTSITDATHFVISPVPDVALSSAELGFQTNPDIDTMGFEMLRIPITSRGYINDSGVNKIVLTGELPTEERYEISEVGIFSTGSNSIAGSYDSKTISAFADTENWQFLDGVNTYSSTAVGTNFNYITGPLAVSGNVISGANLTPAIQTNSSNFTFTDLIRSARYERCRYLNNVLMLRGNTSLLTNPSGTFVIGASPKYFKLDGQTVDFSRNSTSDLLKLAYSLVSVVGDSASVPDTVRVMVEFSNSDGSQYARLQSEVTGASLTNNRYVVTQKRLDELIYNTGTTFSWKSVNTIKVYASAITAGVVDAGYYIALDAIRFDNISTLNPLYGLVGYSIVQSALSETIIKSPNTNNYIEFRFIVDVT